MSSFLTPIITISLAFFFAIHPTTALPPLLQDFSVRNTNNPNQPNSNLPIPLTVEPALCAEQSNTFFKPPGTGIYTQKACQDALGTLYKTHVEAHPDERHEYVNTTTTPFREGVTPVTLPLKIVNDDCTLTIAMRADFETPELPYAKASRGDFSGSDISTYGRIFDVARLVYNECSSGRFLGKAPAGWHSEGDLKAIVVAFWPTQSQIDVLHPEADKTSQPGRGPGHTLSYPGPGYV